MKRSFYNSFRVQMLVNIIGVLIILMFSAAYILFSTIRLQGIVDRNFFQQRYLKDMQDRLEEFQGPFLDFLSTKSSNALSELLVMTQKMHEVIPVFEAVPKDPLSLQEKEVYSLMFAYLDLANTVIEEKRGMDIPRYTSLFDEMQAIDGYINREIESISSARFAGQLSEYERFIETSGQIQFWNLMFILFISLFSLSILVHTVEKINRPMVNLSQMAAQLSAGNFEIEDIGMTRLYEIDHVVSAFNSMKKDLHTYIQEIRWQRNVEQEYMQERVRNMRMEHMLRKMELYTLQAQMNPHFLFNTLNTGIQLAIVEGAERTGNYMEHLAKLFRHNIREKNVIVPLRHEIEGLESYFYILNVRFPKNLDLVLDYPRDMLDDYQIPASILQPLVENSVIHAFKDRQERNSIVVRVYCEEGRLCLSVADNGVGISADVIKSLLHPVKNHESDTKVMGLENVIQRLFFFFPDDPGIIAINSKPGAGTEILIRIDTGRDLCIPS
ncbi:MAG TPA: histidine kinase [Treponemataceae bacterium]|jgi:two-component system sensor histidine kinase YesM|nr:histidine kinase [Treponemataceae bacterium]HQF72397.1 histidine kinase [Treponemataceae bacterium]HRR01533.1 histidine kinase [Treponemataceae bacterium]